jgi:hypothetical protein
MKLLVETAKSFMLMLPLGEEIPAERPAVVDHSHFLQSRIAAGQVNLLGQVTSKATDKEFEEYFEECKGDATLAVESFLSEFGVKRATTKDLIAPPLDPARVAFVDDPEKDMRYPGGEEFDFDPPSE